MKKPDSQILDKPSQKVPKGSKRSDKWPDVRKAHLKIQPHCALCGGHLKLQVHHIRPFHLHPELELEPTNLITLCENKKGGANCHLLFGHLGNFSSFNVDVVKDSEQWSAKIKDRPKDGVG